MIEDTVVYCSTGSPYSIMEMYHRQLLTKALPRIFAANQEQETTYGGTCQFCGNMSGRKDKRECCISCGGPN